MAMYDSSGDSSWAKLVMSTLALWEWQRGQSLVQAQKRLLVQVQLDFGLDDTRCVCYIHPLARRLVRKAQLPVLKATMRTTDPSSPCRLRQRRRQRSCQQPLPPLRIRLHQRSLKPGVCPDGSVDQRVRESLRLGLARWRASFQLRRCGLVLVVGLAFINYLTVQRHTSNLGGTF